MNALIWLIKYLEGKISVDAIKRLPMEVFLHPSIFVNSKPLSVKNTVLFILLGLEMLPFSGLLTRSTITNMFTKTCYSNIEAIEHTSGRGMGTRFRLFTKPCLQVYWGSEYVHSDALSKHFPNSTEKRRQTRSLVVGLSFSQMN